MKVKFPEPVSPFKLYSINESRIFQRRELENLLRQVEEDLDKVYRRIERSDMVIDYSFTISNDRRLLDIMAGGMDLGIEDARKISLPEFKRSYKEFLASIPERINYEQTASLKMLLTGFRDKVIRKVEAQEPD